jgi:hypothetical protein
MEDCINIQNKNGYIERKVRGEEFTFRFFGGKTALNFT